MKSEGVERLLRYLVAGILAGLTMSILDLVMTRVSGESVAEIAWTRQLAVLWLAPAAGAMAGAVFGLLPRIATFLVPAVLAAAAGYVAARGGHARTLPLAAHWWWIGALAVLVATPWVWKVLRRLPRGRGVLLVLSALVVWYVAAFSFRGLYVELREVAILGVAFVMAIALDDLSGRRILDAGLIAGRRGVVAAGILLLALVLGAAGWWASASSQDVSDWALAKTVTAGRLSGYCYALGVRDRSSPDAIEFVASPYFGAEIEESCLSVRRERGVAPRGVLFVTIDALRNDVVGSSVGGMPATKYLDSIRGESAVFNRAYAPSPSSVFSLMAAFSGVSARSAVNRAATGDKEALPLIADRLRRAGVETRASFPSTVHNIRPPGFDRLKFGFEHADLHGRIDPPVPELLEHLKPQRDGRWFAFLHIMAPHFPYNVAPERLRTEGGLYENYIADVRFADEILRDVVRGFEEAGLMDDAILIVSADHGEEFLEHGSTSHGSQLFEETVHVPMFVRGHGVVPGEHDAVVSLTDIAPTVDDLFELGPVGRLPYQGRPLTPMLLGVEDPGRAPDVLLEIPDIGDNFLPQMAALVSARWKFIWDQRVSRTFLFDLKEDPGEKRNLSEKDPERRDERWAVLKGLREHGGEEVLDETTADPTLDYLLDSDRTGFFSTAAHGIIWAGFRFAPSVVRRALANMSRERSTAPMLVDFFSKSDQDEMKSLVALIRVGSEFEEEGDRQLIQELLRATTDPYYQIAIYSVFAERRDPALLTIEAKKPDTLELGVGLARTRYQASVPGGPAMTPEGIELIGQGLEHDHPWIERLAIEATGAAGHQASVDRILARLDEEITDVKRGVIFNALAESGGKPAMERLVKEARGGGYASQLAMGALLARGLEKAAPEGAGFEVLRPEELLTAQDRAATADSLARPESVLHIDGLAEGDLVVLGVKGAPRVERNIRIQVNNGARDITSTLNAGGPAVPIMLGRRPDSRRLTLKMKILKGRPEDVRFFGVGVLRASD